MEFQVNETFSINILTFIDPYLFWFCKPGDYSQRCSFAKDLNAGCSHLGKRITEPVLGKIYITKYEGSWVRIAVKFKKSLEVTSMVYLCWLVDYGSFIDVTEFYEVPDDIPKLIPFAKRGMLYGVRNLKDNFNMDTSLVQSGLSEVWNQGTIFYIRKILRGADVSVEFTIKMIYNGVYIGNFTIKQEGIDDYDLVTNLVTQNRAIFDEDEFKMDLLSNKYVDITMNKIMANLNLISKKSLIKSDLEFEKIPAVGRGCPRKKVTNETTSESKNVSTGSEIVTAKSNFSKLRESLSPIYGSANQSHSDNSQLLNTTDESNASCDTSLDNSSRSKLVRGRGTVKKQSTSLSDQDADLSDVSGKSLSDNGRNLGSKGRGFSKNLSQESTEKSPTKSDADSTKENNSCDTSTINESTNNLKFCDVTSTPIKSSRGRGFSLILKPKNAQTTNQSEVSDDCFDDVPESSQLSSVINTNSKDASLLVLNDDNYSVFGEVPSVACRGRGFSKQNLTPNKPGDNESQQSDSTSTSENSKIKKGKGRGFSPNLETNVNKQPVSDNNKRSESIDLDTKLKTLKFSDAIDKNKVENPLTKLPKTSGRGVLGKFNTEVNNTEIDSKIAAKDQELAKKPITFEDLHENDTEEKKSQGSSDFPYYFHPAGASLANARCRVWDYKAIKQSYLKNSDSCKALSVTEEVSKAHDAKPNQLKKSEVSTNDKTNVMESNNKSNSDSGRNEIDVRENESSNISNSISENEDYASVCSERSRNSKRPSEISSSSDCSYTSCASMKSFKQTPPKCEQNKSKFGHCTCESCVQWKDNSNEIFFKPLKSPEKKTKTIKKPTNNVLLFKTVNNEENLEITGTNLRVYQNMIDKLVAPRLLVHGHFIPKCLVKVSYVPFHSDVHTALRKLKYEKAQRIQTYSWPAVMRGHHVFIINGPESGKTMVYVPAICSFVLSSELKNETTGPLAIIICPGVKSAEKTYKLTLSLLQYSPLKPRVHFAVPPLVNIQKLHDMNKSDILICTPKLLSMFLKEKKIKLKKLGHVVLEDCDETFTKFSKEMEYITACFQNALSKRTSESTIQMILVSKQWTNSIERFARNLVIPPMICIGAHLESALYGRVNILMNFVDSDNKYKALHGALQEDPVYNKTMIICNNRSEVDDVINRLSQTELNYIVLDDTTNIQDVKEAQERWMSAVSGKYMILVCTDEILHTSLFITDASCVVQYSLPQSWTKFVLRFSLFLDNYISPLVKDNETSVKCKMFVFVDEHNTHEYPKIVHFLKRMGCTIPKPMENIYQKIINNEEHSKIVNKTSLCSNLKLFGICKNNLSCSERHRLSNKLDISKTIPQSGIIKFKILHVHNVTHFSVRLLEHIDADNVHHKIKDLYSVITMKMISVENSKRSLLEVELKTVCAVEISKDSLRRCMIIKILKYGTYKNPIEVQVKLLETGAVMKAKTSQLYLLPEELQEIPMQAVEMYIANVGPLHADTAWIPHCREKLLKELKYKDYQRENYFFIGRIKLQLENTVWVNNVVLREKLKNEDTDVQIISVKKFITKQHMAEENSSQLENLYEICKSFNFTLPDYNLPIIKVSAPVIKQHKPMWAHLENLEEFNSVYFCAGSSPGHFYIRLCKNQRSFDILMDEIQKQIHKPFYRNDFQVVEGHCYLGKDPSGDSYSRVIVRKVVEKEADCFFVDFGDCITIPTEELKFLTDEMIARLPFQVIECKLHGLEPANGDWTEQSCDKLYNYALEPDSDLLRKLYVKVVDHEKPFITGTKKYSVILIDTLTNDIINNKFVEEGFANYTSDGPLSIDFTTLNQQHVKDDEMEIDEEEEKKEYTLEEIEELTKKYKKKETEESADVEEEVIEEIVRSDSSSSSHSFALQVNNIDEMVREFFKISKDKPFTGSFNNQTKIKEIDAKLLENPGYSTPDVIWFQTKKEIRLRIQLVAVQTYELRLLGNRTLSFKTEMNEKIFRLGLNLFSKVQTPEHQAFGLYVQVKLMKVNEMEWPRLLTKTERVRYVKYDFMDVSSDDDSDTMVLPKLKPKPPPKQEDEAVEDAGYVFEVGSDIDYDESDIESSRGSSASI